MILLVTGDRNWSDVVCLNLKLDDLLRKRGIELLIQGGARGADTLAKEWAESRGVPVLTEEARWEQYGRAAGPIRNEVMLDMLGMARLAGKDTFVVAFHPHLDNSKGTKNMVTQAKAAGLEVELVNGQ